MENFSKEWKWNMKVDMPHKFSDLEWNEETILTWAWVEPLSKDKEPYGYVRVSPENAKLIAKSPIMHQFIKEWVSAMEDKSTLSIHETALLQSAKQILES